VGLLFENNPQIPFVVVEDHGPVFSPVSGGGLVCSVPCASGTGTMGEQDVVSDESFAGKAGRP
jgi:hypothetical protein